MKPTHTTTYSDIITYGDITTCGEAAPRPGIVLGTDHLTRRVDGRTLVDDVSIAVRRGDVLAVVGPNGAGKSSLLRLLCRLDEPTEGTVFLEGHDYRAIPPRELRRRVSLVAQRPHLFPGTVAENLRYGPRQHGEELDDAAVARLLADVDLPGFAHRDAATLSGGEAQRLALARTLANRPDVLLLDEPTAALDGRAVAEVEALIRAVIREHGLTCLIVTHDAAQARRLAGRALLLRAGRVAAYGPVEEVLGAQPPAA
ncbi:MAG: ATP-binding cassette domain-containing protein [Thermoleophilia bacterium]